MQLDSQTATAAAAAQVTAEQAQCAAAVHAELL
jgi:hypothetical protein